MLTGLLLTVPVNAVNTATYIPPGAYQYIDTLKQESSTYFPSLPIKEYLPSLIEHESCVTLISKRCWQPTAQLKTRREEGAGLPQITRAYTKSGSLRFDKLSEMRMQYPLLLGQANWGNIYKRPDLQIRIIALLSRDNYNKLYQVKDPVERLKFADSAYNGGLSPVHKDRMLCGLQANCNPDLWFNNVERYSYKSRVAIYGNRSAYDINRHHVRDVWTKLPKYKQAFFTDPKPVITEPPVLISVLLESMGEPNPVIVTNRPLTQYKIKSGEVLSGVVKKLTKSLNRPITINDVYRTNQQCFGRNIHQLKVNCVLNIN